VEWVSGKGCVMRDTVAVEARVAGSLPRSKGALRDAVHNAPGTVLFTTTGPGEPERFAGTEVPAEARLWVSRSGWCALVTAREGVLRLD